jgi:endonuclease/exonuclease/phosphatase family metal-dependent hydrolase
MISILSWNAECGHNWGTGIFTAGLPIRPIHIQTSHKCCLSCAEILLSEEGLIVISLYARLEDGKSIKVIHRLISDLTDLLNRYRKKSNIILAGDFNAGLEWDRRQGNNSHRIMFERIGDFGLIDVLKTSDPVQTWRCDKSKVKWQIDYMFVSDKLNERINSAKVLYTSDIEKLSDHNPIELSLN